MKPCAVKSEQGLTMWLWITLHHHWPLCVFSPFSCPNSYRTHQSQGFFWLGDGRHPKKPSWLLHDFISFTTHPQGSHLRWMQSCPLWERVKNTVRVNRRTRVVAPVSLAESQGWGKGDQHISWLLTQLPVLPYKWGKVVPLLLEFVIEKKGLRLTLACEELELAKSCLFFIENGNAALEQRGCPPTKPLLPSCFLKRNLTLNGEGFPTLLDLIIGSVSIRTDDSCPCIWLCPPFSQRSASFILSKWLFGSVLGGEPVCLLPALWSPHLLHSVLPRGQNSQPRWMQNRTGGRGQSQVFVTHRTFQGPGWWNLWPMTYIQFAELLLPAGWGASRLWRWGCISGRSGWHVSRVSESCKDRALPPLLWQWPLVLPPLVPLQRSPAVWIWLGTWVWHLWFKPSPFWSGHFCSAFSSFFFYVPLMFMLQDLSSAGENGY